MNELWKARRASQCEARRLSTSRACQCEARLSTLRASQCEARLSTLRASQCEARLSTLRACQCEARLSTLRACQCEARLSTLRASQCEAGRCRGRLRDCVLDWEVRPALSVYHSRRRIHQSSSTRASKSENHSQKTPYDGVFNLQQTAFLTVNLAFPLTSGAALTE